MAFISHCVKPEIAYQQSGITNHADRNNSFFFRKIQIKFEEIIVYNGPLLSEVSFTDSYSVANRTTKFISIALGTLNTSFAFYRNRRTR